jgi:hypothetical protein
MASHAAIYAAVAARDLDALTRGLEQQSASADLTVTAMGMPTALPSGETVVPVRAGAAAPTETVLSVLAMHGFDAQSSYNNVLVMQDGLTSLMFTLPCAGEAAGEVTVTVAEAAEMALATGDVVALEKALNYNRREEQRIGILAVRPKVQERVRRDGVVTRETLVLTTIGGSAPYVRPDGVVAALVRSHGETLGAYNNALQWMPASGEGMLRFGL